MSRAGSERSAPSLAEPFRRLSKGTKLPAERALSGHTAWCWVGLGLLLGFVVLVPAAAQVQVDVALKRSLYMVYEPLICNVTITNLSGGTLALEDTPREKWFGFQIETVDGRPLPPINPHYQNQTVEIEAGQRLTRSINITPLYPLSEFGTYRVRAVVYVSQLGKYFVSPQLNIEITEGASFGSRRSGCRKDSAKEEREHLRSWHTVFRGRRCSTCGSRTRRQGYLLHDAAWTFHHFRESRHRRWRKPNPHPAEHRSEGIFVFPF